MAKNKLDEVLSKFGLGESDFEWLVSRVAAYFDTELKEPEALRTHIDESDVEVLAEAVKARLLDTAQMEMLAQLVTHQIRRVALLGCTGGSPNCACASHKIP